MRILFCAAILGLVVFVILGVTPLGRAPFQALFEVGEVAKVDFTDAESMRRPARWLGCPGFEMCKELDSRTPIYDNEAAVVKAMWDRMLREQEPGLQLVLADDTARQYTYVSRSAFFQLPDLVTVQILPQGERRAAVAIFSRSVYRAGDFGSNSRRGGRIMDYLDEHLQLYKR